LDNQYYGLKKRGKARLCLAYLIRERAFSPAKRVQNLNLAAACM
jgi:hypothetical protein